MTNGSIFNNGAKTERMKKKKKKDDKKT